MPRGCAARVCGEGVQPTLCSHVTALLGPRVAHVHHDEESMQAARHVRVRVRVRVRVVHVQGVYVHAEGPLLC
jgi:hypothetical protein